MYVEKETDLIVENTEIVTFMGQHFDVSLDLFE